MRRFLLPLAVVLSAVLGLAVNLASETIPLPPWLGWAPWVAIVLLVVAIVVVEGRQGREDPQLSAPEQLTEAANLLAQATVSQWSAHADAWGIGTNADPVRVTWHRDHQRSLPMHEVFGASEGNVRRVPRRRSASRRAPDGNHPGEQGVVTRLYADLYRRIQRQQLVLLGPAGSGKTATMLILLIEAAKECVRPASAPERADTPVPVWVTLGGWNPDERSLLDHVVEEMETNFPALRHPRYGADVARRLVAQKRVALFLDGLDEMPAAGQRAALTRIAREAAGLRIVLTSRIEGYDQARAGGRLPRPVVLQLDKVESRTAVEYLRRGHDSDRQRRFWHRLTEHLLSRPDSPVAQAFATPLILSLARNAFDGPDGDVPDPAELIGLPSVAAVKARVIGQFLERAYPSGSGRRGGRDQRHLFYLSWLAHHLRGRRDLRWWEIPTWIPIRALSIAAGTGIGLPTAVLASACVALTGGARSDVLLTFLGAFLVAVAAVGFILTSSPSASMPTPTEPIGMDLRWPTRAELRMLWLAGSGPPLAVGVGVGLVLGPFAGVLSGLALMGLLIVGPSIGRANVTFGLFGIWLTPLADSPASTPGGTFRADRRRTLVTVSSAVILGGVVFALFNVADPPRPGTWSVGPELGIVIGAMYGVITGLGPAVLTGFAQVVLLLHGRPPVRFPVLFREALRRQVLRQAGVVYQFRHAELQDHLAAAYERRQDAGPARRTLVPEADGETVTTARWPGGQRNRPGRLDLGST
ncbi:NACHT domain-containing protein [Micromonospora sp. NPDC002717]|uniref:NACHT domain-containing protein n=1 Tax=Micromonospora sp. NPDC002717 TaxID=3154424 RepID=UPI0033338EA0